MRLVVLDLDSIHKFGSDHPFMSCTKIRKSMFTSVIRSSSTIPVTVEKFQYPSPDFGLITNVTDVQTIQERQKKMGRLSVFRDVSAIALIAARLGHQRVVGCPSADTRLVAKASLPGLNYRNVVLPTETECV
ncbi:hypothetical protein EVAR_13076_1 [Eumeta japonica]|uniref:Uncharacterized protein n=1 Tax=Eumeta variegata TaxID=151549 RepID=A0A4C2A8Y6_EUMVA|nr:hypothetical protein EVAR_13076_1 [Eumeta japonica]